MSRTRGARARTRPASTARSRGAFGTGSILEDSVVSDALVAGAAAAVLAGVPSTLHALVTGRSILEAAAAAGSVLLPGERRTPVLVAAAVPVHLALSLGWAQVVARMVPRRWPVAGSLAWGVAIAALDLEVIGRRLPRIRALAQAPQWLDHVAYGATVGFVLRIRRRGRGA